MSTPPKPIPVKIKGVSSVVSRRMRGNAFAAGSKGGGDTPKYNPMYTAQVIKCCEAGFTDREIAASLRVSEMTLLKWKREYVEFREAFKLGDQATLARVKRSLLEKSVGYTVRKAKVVTERLVSGATKARIVEYDDHVSADVKAQIFYLVNRDPEHWKNSSQCGDDQDNSGVTRIFIEADPDHPGGPLVETYVGSPPDQD